MSNEFDSQSNDPNAAYFKYLDMLTSLQDGKIARFRDRIFKRMGNQIWEFKYFLDGQEDDSFLDDEEEEQTE